MSVLELLAAMRRNSSNSPLVSILEEAQRLQKSPLAPPKLRKKRKMDKRTRNKKFNQWRKEHADDIRAYNEGLRGMYYHLRREINRRAKQAVERGETVGDKWVWSITLGQWVSFWLACPACEIAPNVFKPAWQLRGRDINTDVQLRRPDPKASWNTGNLEVLYKGKRINEL